MTAILHDHIVLLLEKGEFENPPSWLTQNFNIIEGGTHTGGSSRNKLIVFKDGTYLELFNWIKTPVEFLDWANKSPGLIDFALTTKSFIDARTNFTSLLYELSKLPPSLDLGVEYSPPKAGARKRMDGVEVQWEAFRPIPKTTSNTPDAALFPGGRVDAPFFCHDITERNVRVQFDDDEISTHPCGAVGIESIQVVVPESHVDAYVALYGAVLRPMDPVVTLDEDSAKKYVFDVGVPHPTDPLPTSVELLPAKVDIDIERLDSMKFENSRFLQKRGIGIRGLILKRSPAVTIRGPAISLGGDDIGTTIKLR